MRFAQGESILLTFVSTSPTLGRENILPTLDHISSAKAPSSRTRFEIPKGTDLHMLLGFDKTRGRQWRNDAMTLARLTMTLRKGTGPPVNEKTSRNDSRPFHHFSPARNIHSPMLRCTLLNNVHLRHGNLLATALLFLVSKQVNTHKLRFRAERVTATAISSHPPQWA